MLLLLFLTVSPSSFSLLQPANNVLGLCVRVQLHVDNWEPFSMLIWQRLRAQRRSGPHRWIFHPHFDVKGVDWPAHSPDLQTHPAPLGQRGTSPRSKPRSHVLESVRKTETTREEAVLAGRRRRRKNWCHFFLRGGGFLRNNLTV